MGRKKLEWVSMGLWRQRVCEFKYRLPLAESVTLGKSSQLRSLGLHLGAVGVNMTAKAEVVSHGQCQGICTSLPPTEPLPPLKGMLSCLLLCALLLSH